MVFLPVYVSTLPVVRVESFQSKHTPNQLMKEGFGSSFMTTAITLRRSTVDSSPSLSSFASPAAPDATPPPVRAAPPAAGVAAAAAAAAATPLLLPPSQFRKAEHLVVDA